ncbi:MAG: DUF3857 domain-containing protein [Spirochaetes bacterium]|nr:DUF3857 domain-containing protein [Spirochaetota bacterium]
MYTACLAAGLLAVFVAAHARAPGIEEREAAVIRSFSAGEYDGLKSALEKMLVEYPVHPISVLHYSTLFHLADLYGPEAVEKTAIKVQEAIAGSGDGHAGVCLLRFNCELENLRYRYDSRKAKVLTDRLVPIRIWKLWGPVRKYGPGDIDYPFSPEVMPGGDTRSWKRITVADQDGWLDPGKYVYPNSGVIYAAVSLRSTVPIKIRIFSTSVYRLFLNGREIARNTPGCRRAVRCVRVGRARGLTVMLKMSGSPLAKARMLVTDEQDISRDPEILHDQVFTDVCDASEELDYPHAQLQKEALLSAAGSMRLGLYFDDLESEESIPCYRDSLARSKSDFVSYLLAVALAARDGRDRGSSGYSDAWRIINEIRKLNPAFVPAALKHIEYLIEGRDYLNAYRKAARLVAGAPKYPYAGAVLLKLLNFLGYEAEFEESAALLGKRFPACLYIIEEKAAYYKKRDRNRFIDISLDIVRRKFTTERVRTVIREYSSRGDYGRALALAREYNFNNDFTSDIVDLHIRKRDLEAAREQIFRAILTSDNPYLYYALGVIDIMRSDDPSMYLQKMLSIGPSYFTVSDYLKYINDGGFDNPFRQYLNGPENINASWFKKVDHHYPSSVLYRGRIFILNKDGSSRVYCEEVIHVGSDRGVRRWGDVKIPYRGTFRPVHLKVYNEKGSAADSYTVQKIRGDVYVNINSLKKNSIIHLSYIVDNPLATPRGSALFSLPLELLQQYEEPVGAVSIKVIAPDEMKVNFFMKDRENIVESRAGGLKQYAIAINGIPPVKEELFSGGRENVLYYFSFSTLRGFEDFTSWYNGLRAERNRPLDSVPGQLRKDNLEETIAAVHEYVQREIELQKNVLYYPDYPENTLFRRRGTPEDRTLLGMAMLDHLGIKSYIAFVRNKFLPAAGDPVFLDCFTNILLYVPLDINNAIWLDFSRRFLPCGATAGTVSGAEALVLVGDSYKTITVKSRDQRSTEGRYTIVLSEDGSADCEMQVTFFGSSGGIRSFFDDPRSLEESVHKYFSGAVKGLSIDGFTVENLDDIGTHFSIGARGTAAGVSVPGSRQLILQPVLSKSGVYEYIRSPGRILPLVIAHPINEKETYRYTLPASYEREEIRRDRECKSRFGSARIVITKRPGSILLEAEKSVSVQSTVITPAEYGEFMNFCLELQRIENDTVILNK